MDVWIALLERTNRWEGAAMQWMAVGESGTGARRAGALRKGAHHLPVLHRAEPVF